MLLNHHGGKLLIGRTIQIKLMITSREASEIWLGIYLPVYFGLWLWNKKMSLSKQNTHKKRLPFIKRDIRLWICKVTSWDGNRKRQWVRQHFQRCPQLINKHKLHCNPFFGWTWIVCKVVMWWWERIKKWNGFWHMHRPENTGILCDSRIIFSSL